MILWFVAVSAALVTFLFRDPRIDYRLVAAGSLAPNLVDAPAGHPQLAHTLLASAATLGVVVLATRGRPGARRRWLGVPMGMLVHLVLEGGWTRGETFWWPALGADFPDTALFPSVPAILALEAVGAVGIAWIWRRAGLRRPDGRRAFLRSGRLELAG